MENLRIVGAVVDSTVRFDDYALRIAVGASIGSDFLVHAAQGSRHPTSAEDLGRGMLGSFSVTGLAPWRRGEMPFLFVDSNVAAERMGRVRLMNVEPVNQGERFGVFFIEGNNQRPFPDIRAIGTRGAWHGRWRSPEDSPFLFSDFVITQLVADDPGVA